MIEFQFFDGCPNATQTLKNLKELIKENIINDRDLKITEIKEADEAVKLNFQGSPTILINGIDIYSNEIPKNSNYSCLVYLIEGIRTGILSKDFIRNKYIYLNN